MVKHHTVEIENEIFFQIFYRNGFRNFNLNHVIFYFNNSFSCVNLNDLFFIKNSNTILYVFYSDFYFYIGIFTKHTLTKDGNRMDVKGKDVNQLISVNFPNIFGVGISVYFIDNFCSFSILNVNVFHVRIIFQVFYSTFDRVQDEKKIYSLDFCNEVFDKVNMTNDFNKLNNVVIADNIEILQNLFDDNIRLGYGSFVFGVRANYSTKTKIFNRNLKENL